MPTMALFRKLRDREDVGFRGETLSFLGVPRRVENRGTRKLERPFSASGPRKACGRIWRVQVPGDPLERASGALVSFKVR